MAWRLEGTGYAGGDYRIVLLAPRRWEISHRGTPIGHEPSLKTSFQIAEHHRRETLRGRDTVAWGVLATVATVAAIAVRLAVSEINLAWFVVLIVLSAVALTALVRMFSSLAGHPSDPYRRRLPWERRGRIRRATAATTDRFLDYLAREAEPDPPPDVRVRPLAPEFRRDDDPPRR